MLSTIYFPEDTPIKENSINDIPLDKIIRALEQDLLEISKKDKKNEHNKREFI